MSDSVVKVYGGEIVPAGRAELRWRRVWAWKHSPAWLVLYADKRVTKHFCRRLKLIERKRSAMREYQRSLDKWAIGR